MKIKIGESLSGKSVNRKKPLHPFTHSPIHLSVFILVFVFFITLSASFAEDVYESRLDEGLKNTEAYSYVLIKKAQADPSNAKSLLTEAIKHSPNLPVVYFEMAKRSFLLSPEDIFEGFDYMMQGLKAYKRNFWWLRSIAGLSFISLISSFVIVLIVIICIRFFIEAPLLSHDITEDRKNALLVLSLIPLSLLGPLFFIVGALSILGLYFRKIDRAIVYISILLLFLSPFLLHITNIFLSASSPELRAIVAVNEGRDNKHALSVLKGKDDFVSLFSYGIALKREGHYEEAIAVYKDLLSSSLHQRTSDNPQVYVNLGNCYFSINDIAAAKDFYKKSVEIKPLSSAYYNLSQASKETLDFAKGEEYFLEARKLSRDPLPRFDFAAVRNPNRFVIDETLPMSVVWKYADSRYRQLIKVSPLNSTITIVVAIALIAIFYMLDTRMKSRAYRCKRCSVIICRKCEKEVIWGEMCPQCYKSIVKLNKLDPRDRVARLLEVQKLQARKRNIIKVFSFTPPGIAHIYSGRILVGSLLLWPFLFLLILILLNPFLSTGLSSFSHSWLTIPALILMSVLYILSNISVRRRLNRGWL